MQARGQVVTGFFRRLRGNRNAFSMLMCEPMWGISYNLFFPYMSLYMAALGCSALQIGLVSTVGMVLQIVFSLLAPPITDRLGRKRTTLIFDIISWSGGVLVWLFAQNFWFFLAAAAVQSINRIVNVSWNCLLIEDTDKDLLVPLFSWLAIAGLLSALFAPIGVELVMAFSIVPAMRWMLGAAFVLMTAMFLIRNAFSHETSVGMARMEQSKKESGLMQAVGVFKSAGEIWHNKKTLLFFVLSAVYYAALAVKAPFFALLLTGALRFSDASAGIFAALSSLVMLAIYLFAQPFLRHLRPKMPLSVGLLLCALGALALVPAFPSWGLNLAAVLVSVVLTAVGTSVVQPLVDGLSHASIDNEKRSNMTSILNTLIIGASAPFGWIGGALYTLNSRTPFLAASVMFVASAALMMVLYKNESAAAPGEA